MSIDARNAPHNVLDGIADVFKVAQNMTTVRTFKFATPNDLHAFQTAITGFTVRYDGLASTLAISRRMMVVPIYHKWAATNVRIQIVANAQNTVFKLLAFMEDFAHAEALCFRSRLPTCSRLSRRWQAQEVVNQDGRCKVHASCAAGQRRAVLT